MGRAETFHQTGIRDENAPTGTAIGSRSGSGLTIVALASNQDFNPVENPRQVSAFRYPREYGPRSPKFSRGGFVSAELHTLFLISGTAAVVGHKSNFPYNTSLQLDETFKNLAHLCEEISNLTPAKPIFALDDKSVLRVYLKNPDDYDLASKKLEKVLKRGTHNVIFLHGTICRKELTVEIDGIKVV
jgi:chorismate lyase/3-hydroxybenzoate synthase